MALTEFQRALCLLVAESRISSGESYVAGGAALNESLHAPRLSHDVDLFHDTDEALAETWSADRLLLERAGYVLRVLRERPTFVEAEVERGGETCRLQWVRDSAYRFFPLVTHEVFGLALHPFDLATNKVLALVGRVEARDWIDIIECHDRLQPFGYLAWAACGKDPGFSPLSILEHAARTTHYSAAEVGQLAFAGAAPDPVRLSSRWKEILAGARQIVAALPAEQAGSCVIDASGALCRAAPSDVEGLVRAGHLAFHPGRVRGAFPQLK